MKKHDHRRKPLQLTTTVVRVLDPRVLAAAAGGVSGDAACGRKAGGDPF